MADEENSGSKYFREYNLPQARDGASPKQVAAHQQTALAKLEGWYKSSSVEPRGTILVLPTGGGKTFTAVRFACVHPLSDGFKVLWLAHTHHLLEQAFNSFDGLVASIAEPKSQLTIRVVSGGDGHFKTHSMRPTDDVVIASLQAVARASLDKLDALTNFIQSALGKLLVVFDEAHHAPAPSYRRLLQQLREACPGMILLGLTATPTYSNENKQGWLAKLFPQRIVHQETPQNLMAARVLAKPVFEEARTNCEPNFTDREYAQWIGSNRDIPEEMVSYLATNRPRNEYIVAYYLQHRERFGKTLIFADRWAQCEAICTLLNSRGVRADAVYSHVSYTSGTPEERNRRTAGENAKILNRFRNGELDVLVNVRMLTEGTDVPDVNTVFLTRQTTSQILLTQMVGRALRGPAFGGTEKAFIVSFIDDWKQRIHWAAYEQIADGLADDSLPEYGKRPPIHLISIELIRRLARQMDSGTNINASPFRSFLPLGWFRADFDAQVGTSDEVVPARQLILVYEYDKLHFDAFIEAMKRENLQNFEETSIQFEDVRLRLEEWEGRFFTEREHRIGLALVNDMLSIVRHMAQNDNAVPTFFSFEARDSHDLDGVAQHFIADKLDFVAADQSLRREFVRQDRFWKTIYPKYEQFKSGFDACVNRFLHNGRHGGESSGPVLPSYTNPEPIPDREPSNDLKEQVKSRDQYRCLCCGATKRLQVDHIASSYSGGGRNHLENLQTLCAECNSAKSIQSIVFRTYQTILSTAPSHLPRLSPPGGVDAKDAEKWARFLRRCINFFYQCAAVYTVSAGEKGDRLRTWTIRLFPENNPAWLTPHLPSLVNQIREAREAAGFVAAPDQITVNEQSPARPVSDPATPPIESLTLHDVLHSIVEVEGFKVRISYSDGRRVRGDWTTDIGLYPYKNAANGEMTVNEWKNARCFRSCAVFDHSDFEVAVMDGNNAPCAGQRKLKTVRESYLQ